MPATTYSASHAKCTHSHVPVLSQCVCVCVSANVYTRFVKLSKENVGKQWRIFWPYAVIASLYSVQLDCRVVRA